MQEDKTMTQTAYLSLRHQESVSSVFVTDNSQPSTSTLLISSDDEGVIRNGGRRGSAYGPAVLINQLKKMSLSTESQQRLKVVDLDAEGDFEEKRLKNCQKISTLMKDQVQNSWIHLGGGHDHVFTLASSLRRPFVILNLDAHLDTRVDPVPHSGTPFRDLKDHPHFKGLIQFGIHDFSNPRSNYQPFCPQQQIYTYQRKNFDSQFEQICKSLTSLDQNTDVILSIDADALDQSMMSAVSAPNPHGFTLEEVLTVVEFYRQFINQRKLQGFLGIYEFNPLFDSIGNPQARSLCLLIYRMIGL
jgi:formiminoglutamase